MKKWFTPFIALLGIAGLPSLAPTGDLFWVGSARADTLQNPAQEKQLLSQQAAKNAAAMILVDERAATSYLEVAVDDVGNFTCGIPAGPIMLYGHPGPWSSASTIRVDGIDHWNYNNQNSFGTVVTAPTDIDAVTNESVWDIEGKVKVTENLKIVNGDSGNVDTLQISFKAENVDTVAHDVGVRVMLDTMLGSNDGAPFRVPEVGEVTMEREFTGADVPLYWEAFERLTDTTGAKARGTLTNEGDMPTRIVFADWNNINDTPWDFVVNPVNLVTGDSAVGVYWDPVTLAPGESVTRTTFYGLSGMAVNGNVALSMPATLAVENGAYVPNPFPVTAYVTNSGTLAMSGVTATLTLPAGLTLESGNLTQTIGTVAVGDSQQISWSVNATGTTTGMLTLSALIRGTNMPARTVSETIDIPVRIVETTTTLNAVPNPADFGQDVTLNAAVTAVNGAVPTGNVTFNVDGAAVATQALAAGAASYVATGLSIGAHSASADFAGDGTLTASSSGAITVTVRPVAADTITDMMVTPDPIYANQPVTMNVTVTSTDSTIPSGNVVFSLDGTEVATQALSATGTASYTTANGLAVGSHTVVANYAGVVDTFKPSTVSKTFQVIPQPVVNTTIALTATPPSVAQGTAVILKATVTAADGTVPTGNVTFTVDGALAPVQTLDGSGVATYTTATNLAVGSHTATAKYVGATGSFNPSGPAQITFNVTNGTVCKVPTVITNAESLLTRTSAKLNGRVTPNGCPTTVNFDFGYNNAYGLEVAATPSSIPGAAVVTAVGASTTGLECQTEYHYRTVATNAAGTIYGADRMFKTPNCSDVADAWLHKPNPIVLVGRTFTQDIHINTKGGVVAAYDFTINFDNTKVIVDTMFQNAAGTCDQGVCPGEFALSSPMVVVDNNTGEIRLVAFDANGTGPSNDLQVVQIHFIARNAPGMFPIDLTVNDLSDQLGDPVGNLVGRGSNVAISFGTCGDSDGTGVVNIIDALSIARKLVNLPAPPTINPLLADVDQNNRATIVDAMHIARYYVGLQIGAVNACAIGMPLPPLAQ